MLWRLAVGADCRLFLSLYCIVLILDPEVSRSSVQSSVAAVVAVIFMSLVPVLLYRYLRQQKVPVTINAPLAYCNSSALADHQCNNPFPVIDNPLVTN